MKYILKVLILISVIFFSIYTHNVFGQNQESVNRIMNNFYEKLDKTDKNIDKKIQKLRIITDRVSYIRSTKGDRLSNNSKKILNFIEISINSKIKAYEKENQKIEINIHDIVNGKGYSEIPDEAGSNESDIYYNSYSHSEYGEIPGFDFNKDGEIYNYYGYLNNVKYSLRNLKGSGFSISVRGGIDDELKEFKLGKNTFYIKNKKTGEKSNTIEFNFLDI